MSDNENIAFANINSDTEPSIDGLGVKRWQFSEGAYILSIFLRPSNIANTPYLLRLGRIDGQMCASATALSKKDAISAAITLIKKGKIMKEGMDTCKFLKPCPFCGGQAEIERRGTTRQIHLQRATDPPCQAAEGALRQGGWFRAQRFVTPL
jgi:hypothetical protein